MDANQFGRRNLAPYHRTKLALELEETIKERAKAQQGTRTDLSQKSAESHPIETREELAKLAGVSRDTVDKVKQIEKSATPGFGGYPLGQCGTGGRMKGRRKLRHTLGTI